MQRELPLQAAVSSYQATTIGCLIFRIQGVFNTAGTAQMFVQVFDRLSVPTAGLVPIKSWSVGAASGAFFDYHDIEGCTIFTGAWFVLSSTDATYTAPAGGNTIDIQVDIEEYSSRADVPVPTTTGPTAIGAGGILTILANGSTGPLQLSKIVLIPTTSQNLYLMIFTALPLAGSKNYLVVRPVRLTAAIPLLVQFGDENGLTTQQFTDTANSIISNGLYIALSSTGNVLTVYAGNDVTATTSYFSNTNPLP